MPKATSCPFCKGDGSALTNLAPGAVVLVEVDEPRLESRGASAREIFELMRNLGFGAQSIVSDYSVAAYVRRSLSTPPNPYAVRSRVATSSSP